MGGRLERGLPKSGKASLRSEQKKEAVTEIWGKGSKVRLSLECSRTRKKASVIGTWQSKRRRLEGRGRRGQVTLSFAISTP